MIDSLDPHLVTQDWAVYTTTDHAVWAQLYATRMSALRATVSSVYLRGAEAIGLSPRGIPELARLNGRLRPLTGWEALPVDGFLPAAEFFRCLARRRFPTTITIRPPDQLAYVPEPDIFHDVFGHVPLHADPTFARFLQRIGQLALRASDPATIEQIARLFWFTVEFGLVREEGEVRLYGSGLISSQAEAASALGGGCEHRPFRLDEVVAQSFEIDHLQPVLFVVESFDRLFHAIEEFQGRLDRVGGAV